MRHVLLIGFGIQGSYYINAAKSLNCYVSAIETSSVTEMEVLQDKIKLIDNLIKIDSFVKEKVIDIALEINKNKKIDAVIGFSDKHIEMATLISEMLSLKSPGLFATKLSKNKFLQRAYLKSKSLPVPSFKIVSSDNIEFSKEKIILKPLDKSGSKGVKIINSRLEYQEYLQEHYREIVIEEEFIEGQEISVEIILQNGSIILENITKKYTHALVEKAHTIPYKLSKLKENEILKLSRDVISAIKMNTGILHLEIIMSNQGLFIVEFAVRTPGDYILNGINYAYEVDAFKLIIEAMLNINVQDNPPIQKNISYIEFILSDTKGEILSVEGKEFIANYPNVVDYYLPLSKGDKIDVSNSSQNRYGHYLGVFKNQEELDIFLNNNRSNYIYTLEGARVNE